MTSSPLGIVSSRADVFHPTQAELEKKRQQLRDARLKAARSQANWTEITPPERLVPRGPAKYGWLVDAASDKLWRVTWGTVFAPGTAAVAATHTAVTYYVSADGDVVPLEEAQPLSTWSEVVRRRPDLVRAS